MVFSFVAYLFYKRRSGEHFVLTPAEQYNYMQTITANSETADLILDSTNVVKFANDKFIELFNLNGNQLDNKPIRELGIPDDLVNQILKYKIDNKTFTFHMWGRKFFVKYANVTTQDGGTLGSLIKIHEEKNIVLDEEYVSQWMHELNTPLNAIMGYSELLAKEKNLTKEQKHQLHTISDHSALLKKRIENLLMDQEISRIYKIDSQRSTGLEKILIVDDVTINRTLLKIILKRNGFKVTEAKNGKEAVEKISEDWYDMVLMDLSMPVMDGLEATNQIREMKGERATVPVIAVTASSLYNSDKALREKGFNGLVKKPFKEGELISMIRQFDKDVK
jgi:CheY-like chemotaxis protein